MSNNKQWSDEEITALFEEAIKDGRMTRAQAENEDFMFMGFASDGTSLFKHRDTREYLGDVDPRPRPCCPECGGDLDVWGDCALCSMAAADFEERSY